MTPTLFAPASSKTFWVRREPTDFTILPVIGWTLSPAGAALPVVPGVADTSGPGVAVVCGDYDLPEELAAHLADGESTGDISMFYGLVVDLAFGKPFFHLEDWAEWVDKQGTAPASKPNAGLYPALNFNGKVYLKASFWKVAQPGKTPLIFTLPGGSASPTDLFVTKITRDEFFAARKVLTEVPHLALVGGVTANDPPEDDDADDLI